MQCHMQFSHLALQNFPDGSQNFPDGSQNFPAQQCRSALHLPIGSAKLRKERIGKEGQEVEKNE